MTTTLPQASVSPTAAGKFEREYLLSSVIGGTTSSHPFRRSLAGIAVGPGDEIHALGDGEVRIFRPSGDLARSWKAPDGALCLGVGSDGRIAVGSLGRVFLLESGGKPAGSFVVGAADRPALITSIKLHKKEILVGDATTRLIRRFDAGGKPLGEIGAQLKTGSFMLPNRMLDFSIDSQGLILATDSGRHRITFWQLDGSPAGQFGKFGMQAPEDFVGCCNPVNLAVTPDGKVVTAEKVAHRVKVFAREGQLLAVLDPAHFDPSCTAIHLAVDSKGQILAADPVRREIKVFSMAAAPGAARPPAKQAPRETE